MGFFIFDKKARTARISYSHLPLQRQLQTGRAYKSFLFDKKQLNLFQGDFLSNKKRTDEGIHMKKIITVLLCITLLLSMLILPAQAADTDDAATGAQVEQAVIAADEEIADTGATADELAPSGWSLLTEAQFQDKISAMKSKYPNGSIWEGVYYEGGYARAWTCWAYAAQMLKEFFGVNFYGDDMLNYKYYDSTGVCAGDWVRIDYDSHSIFITKVTSDGVYYTDGNGTGVYNQVRWDGYYTWAQFNSRFSYRLHLPGNNLTGQGVAHTVAYNANGGSGSMASQTVYSNNSFKLKTNGYTYSGYTFSGYTVKRSYDNKWYTTDAGWQTQSNIYDNGYHFKIYPAGNTYTLGSPWIGGIPSSTTFTFYAQWLPTNSTVEFAANYSGYNYILGSALGSNYSNYIYSRNTSVYSVAVDSKEKLNNANTLKITGKSAGSAGSDLAILTSTNPGYGDGYSTTGTVGDEKSFTLHFYAKASVSGAKMYIRWGYNSASACQSISLSTDWKVYSVTLPKNRYLGSTLHPYFDKAGTYYLNSLALGDGTWTSGVIPETGTWAASSQTVTRGGKFKSMPTPTRSGYTFLGWYTDAEGGTLVDKNTAITATRLRLYAHWRKNVSYTASKTVIKNGHVYELYQNQMGWEDASRFCESRGGHLVTIESAAENTTAYNMISNLQGYCWIGLKYDKTAKKWQWVNGSAYSYNKWYSASYATEDSGEYYALLYPMNIGATKYAATWDKCVGSDYHRSYYGYYNSFFICEYDSPDFLGDANGNGEVEITDVTLLQRSQADFGSALSDKERYRGDVDGNGEIEVIDATFIQRYLSQIATPYEVGKWLKENG